VKGARFTLHDPGDGMTEVLTGPFAEALKSDRARFNARFAEARHERPRLDPAAFLEVLRTTVAPIVDAVDRAAPSRTATAAEALFDLALELAGQDLLGPASRYPHIADGWGVVLPLLARHVAQAPRAVAGAVTNALYNLAATSGARPQEWADAVLRLSDVCPDAETLLKAGQVAAWRAGMAQYRAGALQLCRTLPPAAVRAALGLAPTPAPVNDLVAALSANPWTQVDGADRPTTQTDAPRLAARVGAFRGFGGLFMQPPRVAMAGGQFHVHDGDETWLMTADAFGATFHRAERRPSDKALRQYSLKPDGTLTVGKARVKIDELAEATSHAADRTTLAVTTALSHSVFLFAVPVE
jgi:hypothetical protein